MIATPALISNDYLVLAALAIVVVTVLILPKRQNSPPGPPGWPIIGNIFDLPTKESWKVYLDWSKHYGTHTAPVIFSALQKCHALTDSDVLSMRVPGARFFILNSVEAIQELLIKRSSLYSDRYVSPLE